MCIAKMTAGVFDGFACVAIVPGSALVIAVSGYGMPAPMTRMIREGDGGHDFASQFCRFSGFGRQWSGRVCCSRPTGGPLAAHDYRAQRMAGRSIDAKSGNSDKTVLPSKYAPSDSKNPQ